MLVKPGWDSERTVKPATKFNHRIGKTSADGAAEVFCVACPFWWRCPREVFKETIWAIFGMKMSL